MWVNIDIHKYNKYLKPCPFCFNTATVDYAGNGGINCVCTNCGASSKSKLPVDYTCKSNYRLRQISKAIIAWNTRTDNSKQKYIETINILLVEFGVRERGGILAPQEKQVYKHVVDAMKLLNIK